LPFSTVPNFVPTQENCAYWLAGEGSGDAARSTCRNARSIASAWGWIRCVDAPRTFSTSSDASYSGSPIAVHRNHAAEWLFPQEKATFDRISKDICIGEPL
jgi:hypothetical protein